MGTWPWDQRPSVAAGGDNQACARLRNSRHGRSGKRFSIFPNGRGYADLLPCDQRVPTGWTEAATSLPLVDCSRFARTRATR